MHSLGNCDKRFGTSSLLPRLHQGGHYDWFLIIPFKGLLADDSTLEQVTQAQNVAQLLRLEVMLRWDT